MIVEYYRSRERGTRGTDRPTSRVATTVPVIKQIATTPRHSRYCTRTRTRPLCQYSYEQRAPGTLYEYEYS
eukprot:scaffold260408_cov27-Prasinocladus_malaysianus.AAC.1